MAMEQGIASVIIKSNQALVIGTGISVLTTDAKAGAPYNVPLAKIARLRIPYRYRLTAGTGHDSKAKITCTWLAPTQTKEVFTLSPGDVVMSETEGFLDSIVSDIDPKADLTIEAVYRTVQPAGADATSVVGVTKTLPADIAVGAVATYFYNEAVDVLVPVMRKIDPGQDLVPDANGRLKPRTAADKGDVVGRALLPLPACVGKECKLRVWLQPRSL